MRMAFSDVRKTKLPEHYHKLLFGGPGSGPQGGGGNESTNKSDSLPSKIEDIHTYKANPQTGNEGLANETHDILTKMGLNPGNISVSETPSGTSRYISVPLDKDGNKIKIRISDHSVSNVVRMANEVHLNHDNIGEELQKVEKTIHPEKYEPSKRYKKVEIASSYIRPTDKVIKGTEKDVGRTDYHVVTVDREYDSHKRKEALNVT